MPGARLRDVRLQRSERSPATAPGDDSDGRCDNNSRNVERSEPSKRGHAAKRRERSTACVQRITRRRNAERRAPPSGAEPTAAHLARSLARCQARIAPRDG